MLTYDACNEMASASYLSGIFLGLASGYIFGMHNLVGRLIDYLEFYNIEVKSQTPETDHASETNFEELEGIFDKEVTSRSNTVLDRGRDVGTQPILDTNVQGSGRGGYMTNSDLDNLKNKRDSFKRLTREEEIDIMTEFKEIEGKTISEASAILDKHGYSLFINSVGDITKTRDIYCGTVIGVEISDPEYDFSTDLPSTRARVTDILNVGGLMQE